MGYGGPSRGTGSIQRVQATGPTESQESSSAFIPFVIPSSKVIHSESLNISADELHSFRIDVLPLLRWENRVIEVLTVPLEDIVPSHIPQTCAPGTKSLGGPSKVVRNCSSGGDGVEDYQDVFKKASETLNDEIRFPELHLPKVEVLQCDVCRILEVARRHKQNIAMWGDSIQNQAQQGFICELHRRNYNVTVVNDVDFPKEASKMVQLLKLVTYTISSVFWEPSESVQFQFYFQYRPRLRLRHFIMEPYDTW